MVRVALLALLAVAAVLPPPAAAQAAAPQALLEDSLGDVQVMLNGQPAAADPALYTCADLEALALAESRTEVTFTLTLGDLKPPEQDPAVEGCRYDVYFTHHGREFRLYMDRGVPSVSPFSFVMVAYRDAPDAEWSTAWVSDADGRWDVAADTYTAAIPRDVLADADGAAPYPGRVLEGIRAEARSLFGGSVLLGPPFPDAAWPAYAADSMPNDASQAASFTMAEGVAQTGDARLSSGMPFRASNGEATTFVYNVTAANLGEDPDVYELVATPPAGHTLVLPVPVVKLEGGAETSVPVLLTMPFGHQHGELASFILEMRSLTDPGSVGRLEMGVRFLAVPQPAGHHDTVYLHSGQAHSAFGATGGLLSFEEGYFNTLEVDPADTGLNQYNTGLSMYDVGQWAARWYFPLSPTLEIGLDVDPGKAGYLRLPVGTTFPIFQASLTARVVVAEGEQFYGEEILEVASGGPSPPVDIAANSQALIEVPLLPPEDGGRVESQPGRQLEVWVELRFTGPNTFGVANENVYVAPGGSARLPLREFHDEVDDALAALDGPRLSALDAQERLVNPGEAVVFPVSVANPLDEAVDIRFELSGANAEWASLPSVAVRVPPHGTAQASVVVRAPAAALDLQRADLVLQAYDEGRPEARGLLRLVAEVDTDADQPDDTAAAAGLASKDSPPAGLALLAAGLAVAALAARRRQR